ncbi:MAG: hypothetical protein IJ679_10280 [Lachnospiraceae bacterium]|nr:hypothetical protein [Lachnospiraceae bacterium]
MIDKNHLLTLSYYEKAPFTGSDAGLRYRIEKTSIDGEAKFLATAWRGPFAFDHTPDEEKTTHTASFSDEGLESIVAWLNTRL